MARPCDDRAPAAPAPRSEPLHRLWDLRARLPGARSARSARLERGREPIEEQRHPAVDSHVHWYGENGVTQGQAFFATLETPEALQAEAAWIQQRQIGGMMLYEIGLDMDANAPVATRNPLVNAARAAMAP